MLSKHRATRQTFALLIAASVAVTACGGDDGGTGPDPVTFDPVMSDFEVAESVDGWSANRDAAPNLSWQATGGNPGGFISVDDLVRGVRWYWVAPSKYLGNKSDAYGLALEFDLIQGETTDQLPADSADVLLFSGDLTIAHRMGRNPGTDWTSYRIPLSATGSWFNHTTGSSVGEPEIRQVLGALDNLWIRGEFRDGSDFGGLDNVVFGAP